jgi:hypothetical protein
VVLEGIAGVFGEIWGIDGRARLKIERIGLFFASCFLT